MSTIDCNLHFHATVLLARYIAASILSASWSVNIWAGWPHPSSTKTDGISKRELSGVSKETSPILDLRTLTRNILNRRGKSLRQFFKKMVEKEKKRTRCGNALCLNIQTQELANIFENICLFYLFNCTTFSINFKDCLSFN